MALVEEQGDGYGLEGDADVGGDGEAGGSVEVVERVVDGERDNGDGSSSHHGGHGVSRGIECAGVDGLCGPEKHGDREYCEVDGAEARVGGGEASSGEDEVDERLAQRDHGRGDKQAEGSDARDRVCDADGKLIVAFLRPHAGEEGHGCRSRGLGEHGHGRGKKLLGVAHQRDSAADLRSEVSDDPAIRGDQGDARHER